MYVVYYGYAQSYAIKRGPKGPKFPHKPCNACIWIVPGTVDPED